MRVYLPTETNFAAVAAPTATARAGTAVAVAVAAKGGGSGPSTHSDGPRGPSGPAPSEPQGRRCGLEQEPPYDPYALA